MSDLEARVAELEAQVRALDDERRLRELLTQYSFGADVERGEAWTQLFTPDGVYDLGSQNVDGAYAGRFSGHDELRGLITGDQMPPHGRTQHHHGPMVFRTTGDTGTGESYSVTYLLGDDGTSSIYCIGFNRWVFARVDGQWRIKERHRREIGAPDQHYVIAGASAEDAGISAEAHGSSISL